jgi:hypothetical protein
MHLYIRFLHLFFFMTYSGKFYKQTGQPGQPCFGSSGPKYSLHTKKALTPVENGTEQPCRKIINIKFFVFSTMHHSIDVFHLQTLMHSSLFINNMYVTLQSSTCFDHQHAHLQEDKLYYHSICYRHSLYITVQYAGWEQTAEQSALIRHTVQTFTENDVTRCCDNKICPPEDWRVDDRNMSRIIM